MAPQTPWIKQRSEEIKSKLGTFKRSSTIYKLAAKLRNPAYRKAFVASQINIGIPFQIRALMKTRGWTQEKLAERTGMLQPRISAMLKPGKVRPNIETLRRIAEAFDCALLVKFAPFSELALWSESFDPENFNAPAFEEDHGFVEEPERQSLLAGRLLNTASCLKEAFQGARTSSAGQFLSPFSSTTGETIEPQKI